MARMSSLMISQSSRASAGGMQAALSFCRRPVTLIMLPRFSAELAPGKTMSLAWAVALVVLKMEIRSSRASMSSAEKPASSRSSHATITALIEPLLMPSLMAASFWVGSSSSRIRPAPVVLGLRSLEINMLSDSCAWGMMLMKSVPSSAASVRIMKSSSLVCWPDAMMAISLLSNCLMASPAAVMELLQQVSSWTPSALMSGALKRLSWLGQV